MYLASASGRVMEVLERYKMKQKMEAMKGDTLKRNVLRCFLKYEIQSLVQRLAEIGDESVVVTANVLDGSHTVLASQQGEQFLQNKAVANFMDHFVRHLFKGGNESPKTDDESTNESCSLKSEDGNKSRDKLYPSQPETFMHMKKHQIEQYNRRKDSENRSIDDEVSKLVKNILKEGKEKEKLRGCTSLPAKRKRGSSSLTGSEPVGCSSPKRIAELFPTLTPMLAKKPLHNTYYPQCVNSNNETNNEKLTVIKSEPVDDDDEYGGKADIVIENDNAVQEAGDSVHSSLSSSSNNCSSTVVHAASEQNGVSDVVSTTSKCSQTCDQNETSDKKDVNDTDEEIDLPFVEPFYKDREKCVEDVKLTPQEIGTAVIKCENEVTASPVTCYKQSRKKSSIFNLVLNGYSYIRDKQGNGGTIYWKCGRPGCKGRVIQRDQELIISQRHCHTPTM